MDGGDAVALLERLGGTGTWRELRQRVGARHIRAAMATGTIRRTTRGRYVLPSADAARIAATVHSAVVSHTSAAAHWGWKVKTTPVRPHLTVRRHRRMTSDHGDVCLHYRDLPAGQLEGGWVTTRVRTVVDCCLDLPFDEALAVVDSAWRDGLDRREVEQAAELLPARQRSRVLTVTAAGDARAANPFESVARAVALPVPGLALQPQLVIRDGPLYARVDLGDRRLKLVVEADSFEFHGTRKAFDRDCRRYNALVVRGWLVLRFTWELVMFEPDLVLDTIRLGVALQRLRAAPPTGSKRSLSRA